MNGYDKPTPNTVLLEVLTQLTDIDNRVISHSFITDKPSYNSYSLAISISVKSEMSETTLTNVLTALFNGGDVNSMTFDGLNINQSLSKEEIARTLEIFDNIVEVTSIKYLDGSTPTDFTTLTPSTNSVLELSNVSFTQSEV